MAAEHLFAGVPVADFESALAWYETLFGRPPDVVPRAGVEATWQLTGGGWIYIVVDPRAGNALVTVLVDDLDVLLADVTARGVDPGPVEERPGLYRKCVITDPDGNEVAFGQSLQPA